MCISKWWAFLTEKVGISYRWAVHPEKEEVSTKNVGGQFIRILHQKRRFGTRFRETVITNPVLTQNDAKRILHQKRRFGTRFRETVITNAVLSQTDAKRNLAQKKRCFGTRFRKTVITYPVLSQIDAKLTFHQKSSLWH